MDVLVITTSFPVTGNEASGRFVHDLITHAENTLSTVVTPSFLGQQEAPVQCDTIFCRYAPARFETVCHAPGGAKRKSGLLGIVLLGFLFISMLTATLWQLLRRPRLVHAHWSFSGAVAAIATTLAGGRYVLTLHGSDVELATTHRLFRLLLKIAVSRASHIVCVSDALASRLTSILPGTSNKVSVIHNGIADYFLPDSQIRKHVAHSTFVAVTTGSMVPGKRIDVVLSLLPLIPELRLVVIGDGPLRAELEELARQLRITDYVRFAGQIPVAAVARELRNADIFITASESEGFGLAVVEAAICGLPVVARCLNVYKETLPPNAAVFVEGNSMDDWVTAVRQARTLLPTNRELVALRERYSWSRVAGAYQAIYSRISQRASPT